MKRLVADKMTLQREEQPGSVASRDAGGRKSVADSLIRGAQKPRAILSGRNVHAFSDVANAGHWPRLRADGMRSRSPMGVEDFLRPKLSN